MFGRSLKLRVVSAGGCNGCELDVNVLGTIVFDLGRFGIQIVASPRHADGLLLTGPVSHNMHLALKKTYDAIPAPKIVIAVGACSFAAHAFYGYMRVQTGGEWSAPLDDVFIHFDYARATARGYPFQWSEGNGFSSGNTSLSYPFVLAFGYWVGFRGLLLMKWAAIV